MNDYDNNIPICCVNCKGEILTSLIHLKHDIPVICNLCGCSDANFHDNRAKHFLKSRLFEFKKSLELAREDQWSIEFPRHMVTRWIDLIEDILKEKQK